MDDPSAHVIEYISYILSISVVLTINGILGCVIFVSGCKNERANGALNDMDFSTFS